MTSGGRLNFMPPAPPGVCGGDGGEFLPARCGGLGRSVCRLFASTWVNITGGPMGREDVAAGRAKQLKGKANDVMGAIKGDTSQQAKGKIQKAVGKAQSALGKGTKKPR